MLRELCFRFLTENNKNISQEFYHWNPIFPTDTNSRVSSWSLLYQNSLVFSASYGVFFRENVYRMGKTRVLVAFGFLVLPLNTNSLYNFPHSTKDESLDDSSAWAIFIHEWCWIAKYKELHSYFWWLCKQSDAKSWMSLLARRNSSSFGILWNQKVIIMIHKYF